MRSRIGLLLCAFLCAVSLPATTLDGEPAQVAAGDDGDAAAAPEREVAPLRLPDWRVGLDYVFVRMAAALAEPGDAQPDWREMAESHGVPVDEAGRVLVYVDANARLLTYNDGELVNPPQPIPESLKETLRLTIPGLEIRPTTSQTRFWAWVEPAAVPSMFEALREQLPNVVVQRPKPALSTSPGFGSIVSDGVFVMDLDEYQDLGVRGGNIPVAILDLEFGGVEDFASETGPIVTHSTQDDLNDDSGSHGTSCLEIFRDTAPSIGPVYAVREGSTLDFTSIVSWLIQRSPQPKVISHSTAYFGYPDNGSVADAARSAISAGIIWVVAAGNFANARYWEADNPAFNADFVQFDNGLPLNQVQTVMGQSQVRVVFSYERPDGSFAGLRAVLYEDTGSGPQEIDIGNGSAQLQIVETTRQVGASYYVGIERFESGPVARMRLQAADLGSTFDVWVPEGSMSNPAAVSDPRVVSVGAVPVNSYNSSGTPASYSSQGGGIFNLVLSYCGPTDVATASSGIFAGTSAATPHVAGLVATKLSHAPFADDPLDHVRVIDIQNPGYDPRSGEGLAAADVLALLSTLPDPNEPNDTIAEATDLGTDPRNPSKGKNVSIFPQGDVDWFRFRVSERAPVRIELSGPEPAEMLLRLYDGNEVLIAEEIGGFPKITGERTAGTYFIEVREATDSATIANYTLAVVVHIDRGGCGLAIVADPSRDVGLWWSIALFVVLAAGMRRRYVLSHHA